MWACTHYIITSRFLTEKDLKRRGRSFPDKQAEERKQEEKEDDDEDDEEDSDNDAEADEEDEGKYEEKDLGSITIYNITFCKIIFIYWI